MATPTKQATKTAATKPKVKKLMPDIKLTAALINILCVLHVEGKPVPLETVAKTPADTKLVNKLVELGLASKDDKGRVKYAGLRCKVAAQLVEILRLNGGTMTASDIGSTLWADPKVSAKDPKAAVRYIAPAGAALKTAFNLGIVFKTEGTAVPEFGVVA